MKNKSTFCSFLVKLTSFLAIASSFAYLIPPDKFVYLAFIGLLFPWFQIINFLFIFFGVSKVSCPIRYNVVAFLVSLFMLNNFLSFDKERDVYGQVNTFSVMTYNIKTQRVFESNKNERLNPELDSIISVRHPDVVCLQEAVWAQSYNVPKQINIGGATYYIGHSNKQNIIFSKFPIFKAGNIELDHTSNSVIYADVSINDTPVRVYNCHLQSFRINPSEYKLYDTLQFKSKKQRLQKGKEFLVKMSNGFKERAKQSRMVKEHINNANMLTVVCGDFNSTPSSYAYQTIKKGLEDTFMERGFGYGSSYRRNVIGVRIDYVLHSTNIGANSYETLPQMSSDHCPVYTTLHVK